MSKLSVLKVVGFWLMLLGTVSYFGIFNAVEILPLVKVTNGTDINSTISVFSPTPFTNNTITVSITSLPDNLINAFFAAGHQYWYMFMGFGVLLFILDSLKFHILRWRDYDEHSYYTPSASQASEEIESEEPEPQEIIHLVKSPVLTLMECPNCRGELHFREGHTITDCPHCGKQVLLAEGDQR